MVNGLTPNDHMNHFVALSKCLPGLNGAIPCDSSKEEHQRIESLRVRIIASMNKLLDEMELPGAPSNTERTVADLAKNAVNVCVDPMRKLRDALLVHFTSAEHAKIIQAAVDTALQQMGRDLHSTIVSIAVKVS